MQRFLSEVAAQYQDLDLVELERQRDKLVALHVESIDGVAISSVSKIPFKVEVVLQALVSRCLDITEGFVAGFNARTFTPLFVMARAALETAATSWDLSQRAKAVVQDHESLPHLDDHLMRLILGTRDPKGVGRPEDFPAASVLTALDRATRKDGLPAREFYDMLSEYAHPNFEGLTLAYTEAVTEGLTRMIAPFDSRPGALVVAVNALISALALTSAAIEVWQREVDGFVSVCERDCEDGE